MMKEAAAIGASPAGGSRLQWSGPPTTGTRTYVICANPMRFFLVLLVTVLSGRTLCSDDPCSTLLSIGDTKRTTTEDPGTCGGLCDFQIQEGNWYRLDYSNSGARMPESCVPVYSCGTYIPIRLGGPHPTADNPGPITVPVCAQLTTNGPCCEWTDQIRVKWCSSGSEYIVYQLKKPPFCDMAYCAGTGPNCGPEKSWNDLINNCSDSKHPPLDANPTLIPPYISDTRSVRDRNGNSFTATKFSMKCTLTYTRQTNDSGARYDVAFVADGYVVYSTILKSTDLPEVVMSETYLTGRVNQNVFCRVNSYWKSDYPLRSPFKWSQPYTLGFVITNADTNAVIGSQTTLQEGDKLRVTVRASFPITTPGCYDGSVTPCDPYYNFNVLTINKGYLYFSKCTIQVANGSNSQISLSPIAETNTLSRTGDFHVVSVNTIQTQTSIFRNYQSPTHQITISQRTWLQCISVGDPHVDTFYGKRFTTYATGDHVMLSVPSRKIEIQVRLVDCGSGGSCNCAVVAREENNILGVDACSKSWIPIRYMTDTNNPGGYITQSGKVYTIVLPSGTSIKADFSRFTPRYIHITVSMYLNPTESGTGFCFHNPTGIPTFIDPYPRCDYSTCKNLYRVPVGNSLIDIRPAPSPNPACFNDAMLVPQCDCSTGTCSLPTGISLTNYGHTCNAPLLNKRKRQAPSEPTTLQPPPPSGGVNNVSWNWPTPVNHITKENATDACNNALTKSASYELCTKQLKMNVSFVVEACVLDIQVMDDFEFPLSYVPLMLETQCNLFIDALNSTNPLKNTSREFYDNNVCPGQCSSRGTCTKGACQCNSGFVGSDCSVGDGQPPHITGLVSEVCDIQHDSDGCQYVFVQASDLSTKVFCQINDTSGTLILIDYSPDVYRDLVRCHLPNLLSTEEMGCYAVRISISNDQRVYSNWGNFTIIDSEKTTYDNGVYKPKSGYKCCSDRNLATASLLVLGYLLGKYALCFALQ